MVYRQPIIDIVHLASQIGGYGGEGEGCSEKTPTKPKPIASKSVLRRPSEYGIGADNTVIARTIKERKRITELFIFFEGFSLRKIDCQLPWTRDFYALADVSHV
jgi:hypothetical protein